MAGTDPVLTLASRSPRRRELLAALGLALELAPADLDESPLPGEAAAAYVRRLAVDKARAAATRSDATVLAADTVVVLDGELLGKPADAGDAHRMLRRLSGREHQVLTGVCVRRGPVEDAVVVETDVTMAPLTDAQIAWYVTTGEPLDKAGAYAVQGVAGAFVTAVRGSISGVVGLPLAETLALLARVGFPLPWERS